MGLPRYAGKASRPVFYGPSFGILGLYPLGARQGAGHSLCMLLIRQLMDLCFRAPLIVEMGR